MHIVQLAGFTLLIYDAYRPQQAQQNLWLSCSDPDYVIPPDEGSNHCRGTVVDVTLVDKESRVVDMGTGFDEIHPRSHAYHPAVPMQALRHRLLLNAIIVWWGIMWHCHRMVAF
ncbi:D-alanyl-D-alanine dipeptidase [Erwinia sp. Ejp617]|nr:D-alanyl-D-alanine dipeptidase [Erwinia sp. Ejp617]